MGFFYAAPRIPTPEKGCKMSYPKKREPEAVCPPRARTGKFRTATFTTKAGGEDVLPQDGAARQHLLLRVAAEFADIAIARALAAYPDLGSGGFGGGNYAGPFDRQQIAAAMLFLHQCGRTATPNRAIGSSYSIKHMAERWSRSVGLEPYIANGNLICAAVGLNFAVRRFDDYGSPNAAVGIAIKDLKRLTAPHGWCWS
jgi:hypothetical protein